MEELPGCERKGEREESSNYSRFNEKLEAGYWMQEGGGDGLNGISSYLVRPKADAPGEGKRLFFSVWGVVRT